VPAVTAAVAAGPRTASAAAGEGAILLLGAFLLGGVVLGAGFLADPSTEDRTRRGRREHGHGSVPGHQPSRSYRTIYDWNIYPHRWLPRG
jgi:hypothetical protein